MITLSTAIIACLNGREIQCQFIAAFMILDIYILYSLDKFLW